MNVRHYRNYKNRISKWYFVSYNFSQISGLSGFGSIELQLSGKPNLNEIEKFILENNSELKNAIVLNIVPTRKKYAHKTR